MANKTRIDELAARAHRALSRVPHLAYLLAALALFLYAVQSYQYIYTLRSILDEGLYLVKGYYFATGKYAPFQDYGPLTNHMPLAFLIPGLIQKWFGPGLLVGRYYSFALGLLTLLGLWVAAKRPGGNWWAAGALWAVVLNVSLVKIYSVAFSQVLVAALLSWTMAVALGRRMRWWEAALAGMLSGLLLMTRINMAPLLFLLILYVFWQHGYRKGAIALLAAGITVAGLHALYWPGILRMWANWLPKGVFPFLQNYAAPWRDSYRFTPSPFGVWIRNLDDITWNPIFSFWDGVRFNFVAVVGVFANLLLWPWKQTARKEWRFRAAVFLNLSFLVLFLIHAWAALSGTSCHIFCFSGYIAFFNILGLLALIATYPYWRRSASAWRTMLVLGFVILLGLGVGLGSADDTGKWFAELSVPIFRSPGLTAESIPLWGLMQNRFGMGFREARKVLPALGGLVFALFLLGLAGLWRWRFKSNSTPSLAAILLNTSLLLGLLLSPTPILSGGDGTLDCGGNVVANYEAAGRLLRQEIEPGASIYYQGANSPILLLYLGDVEIYPPQLNNVFSFSDLEGAAITDELLRYGYWNQALMDAWREEADYVLLEGRRYADWQAEVESGQRDIRLVTEAVEPCRGKDSEVFLLGR